LSFYGILELSDYVFEVTFYMPVNTYLFLMVLSNWFSEANTVGLTFQRPSLPLDKVTFNSMLNSTSSCLDMRSSKEASVITIK